MQSPISLRQSWARWVEKSQQAGGQSEKHTGGGGSQTPPAPLAEL